MLGRHFLIQTFFITFVSDKQLISIKHDKTRSFLDVACYTHCSNKL